jgi:hypothetical protein
MSPVTLNRHPDSGEHGHAFAARTGHHSLPDWDGLTVLGFRLWLTGQQPQGNRTRPAFMSPVTLDWHPDSDEYSHALAAGTCPAPPP